jgi:hypothetical protein
MTALGIVLLLRSYLSHTSNPMHSSYNQDDAELIQKVESAVKRSVPPENIEQFVGKEAFINTWRPEPEYGLGRWSMAEDIGGSEIGGAPIMLRAAKKVMVWSRPVQLEDHYPRVVGILWDQDDKATEFTAVLAKPR